MMMMSFVNLFVIVVLGVIFVQALPQKQQQSTDQFPVITAEEVEQAFEQFKRDHRRVYLNEQEEQQRMLIFADNLGYIRGYNWERARLGLSSFTLGVNRFADLTHAEFRKQFISSSGVELQEAIRESSKTEKSQKPRPSTWTDLPTEVDWTAQGVVSPVKDQGPFGQSFVFSAVGAIEGVVSLWSGNFTPLSEQNLIDCCQLQTGNCSSVEDAFSYVEQNKGIDTEQSYPYTSGTPGKCTFSPQNVGAIIVGFGYTVNGNESDLQDATANVGPISVQINASLRSFQFYREGVYDDLSCTANPTDHALLVVGYGVANGTDGTDGEQYWKVKNSWGVNWGEAGYMKLARNQGNLCGIASFGEFPLIHKDI